MKLSDYSSPYDSDEIETKKLNRTIRRKITDQKQFEFLINKNDEEDGLANFNPITPAKITKSKNDNEFNYSPELPEIQPMNPEQTLTQYPPPVVQQPYYQPIQKDVSNDKLNYIIRLLEEQKDEKTDTVTEEFILYGFLGIFIIFVLDSFIKTGKVYTR